MDKKNTWRKFRHRVVHKIVTPLLYFYFRCVKGYKFKKYKLEKDKSYLVFSNHVTWSDQFFVAFSFNQPIYFMTSNDLFNKWFGKYLSYLCAPIPKAKSTKDFSAIRSCRKVVSEGGIVGIFPEGNRTYSGEQCYIDIAVAKMCKVLKTDLILYNIHGGFGVSPRFGNGNRKGKLAGDVAEIITAEEIAGMDTEVLYERILSGLSISEPDLDKTPKEQLPLYKSKHRAEYLERSLYICPNCGGVGTIYTKQHDILCKNCDLTVEYQENRTLKTKAGKCEFETVAGWYRNQGEKAIELFGEESERKLSNTNVQLLKIIDGKIYKDSEGDVEFTQKEGFNFFVDGEKYLNLPFEEIENIALMDKKKMIIYSKDSIYHIKENYPTSLLKYVHMFYIYKQKKEGIKNDRLFMGL